MPKERIPWSKIDLDLSAESNNMRVFTVLMKRFCLKETRRKIFDQIIIKMCICCIVNNLNMFINYDWSFTKLK